MVLLIDKASSIGLMTKFVRQVFPLVDLELAHWQQRITQDADPHLVKQALASTKNKKFHCQGGSIYSLYPEVKTPQFVRLVVALQTISDYLDNLCDRTGVSDEAAFRQLHLAMTDALDTTQDLHDYYAHYPLKNDGGYLTALVIACRQEIERLPAYDVVKPQILQLAGLYSDLQTYKHLACQVREQKIDTWWKQHLARYPELFPWEFAAASGSTLGLFMLCALASNKELTADAAQKTLSSYFPWICGLHILLDYFIDRSEDLTHGELNFVTYYKDDQEILSRLTHFCHQALYSAREMPNPLFAETVVQGLLALYLSDPKMSASIPDRTIKTSLLAAAGGYTRFIYALCRILRRRQIL